MTVIDENRGKKISKKHKKNIKNINVMSETENSDVDSSDYESKSEVSERNITKARGGNNAEYEMEDAGNQKLVRGAKPNPAVIDESPEHYN